MGLHLLRGIEEGSRIAQGGSRRREGDCMLIALCQSQAFTNAASPQSSIQRTPKPGTQDNREKLLNQKHEPIRARNSS